MTNDKLAAVKVDGRKLDGYLGQDPLVLLRQLGVCNIFRAVRASSQTCYVWWGKALQESRVETHSEILPPTRIRHGWRKMSIFYAPEEIQAIERLCSMKIPGRARDYRRMGDPHLIDRVVAACAFRDTAQLLAKDKSVRLVYAEVMHWRGLIFWMFKDKKGWHAQMISPILSEFASGNSPYESVESMRREMPCSTRTGVLIRVFADQQLWPDYNPIIRPRAF